MSQVKSESRCVGLESESIKIGTQVQLESKSEDSSPHLCFFLWPKLIFLAKEGHGPMAQHNTPLDKTLQISYFQIKVRYKFSFISPIIEHFSSCVQNNKHPKKKCCVDTGRPGSVVDTGRPGSVVDTGRPWSVSYWI